MASTTCCNLKAVSVEVPKRQLTVFTGVSGSGKSSLVFGTIAAASQRLINETYSAFVQSFMGADPRSTVGTATDANAMLRILFSRLGEPHIGSPQAFSFNVASIRGAGAVTVERGGRATKERRSFSILGGMCSRCEGRGAVNDIDLTREHARSSKRLKLATHMGKPSQPPGVYVLDEPMTEALADARAASRRAVAWFP